MLLLQVAPEALLDIDVEEEEEEEPAAAAGAAAGVGGGNVGGASAAKTQSVQGEIAFLSHEPVVSTVQLKKGKTRAGEGPACAEVLLVSCAVVARTASLIEFRC